MMNRTIWPVLLAGMIGCSDQSGKDETHEADTGSDSTGGDTGRDSTTESSANDTETADSTDSSTESSQRVDANGIPVFENCPVEQAADACADGWCRIEPGTFLWGTPEDAGVPCSSNYGEFPVQVTLTRPFLMQQHEVTQAQWEAVGFPNPSRDVHPDKPITWINWFEAAAYCNALSEKEGLDTCYDLSACQGEVGNGCPTGSWYYDHGCSVEYENYDVFVPGLYVCNGEVHKYPNRYDCPGYRLPTGAEWQYAARACTSTATYNGDISPDCEIADSCQREPVLDPIAWYCGNIDALQVVKTRKPNLWKLYDMLGNANEFVDQQTIGLWLEYEEGKDGPLTDPVGHRETDPDGVHRKYAPGGSYRRPACRTRPAYMYPDGGRGRGDHNGFRPVLTIFPAADTDSGK